MYFLTTEDQTEIIVMQAVTSRVAEIRAEQAKQR